MTETISGILCTSLMPNNFDLQYKAVSSWREAGFEIISVNCEEEISQLNGKFIDVKFISVSRDARLEYGKPLVYIDDALAALTTTKASINGIINSDIVLRAPGLSEKLEDVIKGKCLFANRTDVYKIKETYGPHYKLGYDLFLFDPSLPIRIPTSNFCLGMPWWDYWLPVAAMLTGFLPVYIDSHIAFHQKHTTNWANDTFYDYGAQMRRLLVNQFDSNQGYDFKQDLEKFITVYFGKNIKKRQDALCAMDLRQTDRLILPPFAEAICAFIRYSAKTVCFD